MPRSPGPSRRALLAGAATAIAAGGLPVAFPRRSHAASPVLRIAQWAHFVPAYDDWFDRKFAREWGERNGVTVEVDHLSLSELRVRADTEVATQQGHDLFAFPESPVAYEPHVTPLTDVVTECERRFGRLPGFVQKGAFSLTDQAVLRRSGELGPRAAPLPERSLGRRRDQAGHLGARPRGRPQDPREARGPGRVRPLARARQQHDAPRPPLGVRRRRAGRGGPGRHQLAGDRRGGQADGDHLPRVHDPGRVHVGRGLATTAPSCGARPRSSRTRSRPSGAWRRATPSSPSRWSSRPPPPGPPGAWRPRACSTATSLWKFSDKVELAKRFLVDLVAASDEAFRASEFYNLPCFPRAVPDLARKLGAAKTGPARKAVPAQPADRYALLAEADRWSAFPGHPGHLTPAIDETLQRGVIPLDVRARRARRAEPGGLRARRRGGDAPHLRPVER